MLRIAFGPLFLLDLWASWAVSAASWDHLGAVLGRLAASGIRLGTPSGRAWAVLGASWGVVASWGRLGNVLGHLGSVSGQIPRNTSVFNQFVLSTSIPET